MSSVSVVNFNLSDLISCQTLSRILLYTDSMFPCSLLWSLERSCLCFICFISLCFVLDIKPLINRLNVLNIRLRETTLAVNHHSLVCLLRPAAAAALAIRLARARRDASADA